MDPTPAILVTGASTGIGRKITEQLATSGHIVYAGARTSTDINSLGMLKNVRPMRLDVTVSRDIDAAVAMVKEGGLGLYGIVNNAGIATLGPILSDNEKEFNLIMDVNVRGTYRITKAFAQQIIASKGRIVVMSSISGILAACNHSLYSMSKHAIEAFADSLRLEMASLGVRVSVIEPGNVNTDIARNAALRIGTGALFPDLSTCQDPSVVADAVVRSLFDPCPKCRYLVVSDEDEAARTIGKQIEQLVQLNEGHEYTYERELLISMLDEQLARALPRTQHVQ